MKMHNFYAGPSILPQETIKSTADALINFAEDTEIENYILAAVYNDVEITGGKSYFDGGKEVQLPETGA